MRERPILFSAAMIRALQAGTKTQTRRVIKSLPLRASQPDREGIVLADFSDDASAGFHHKHLKCPYGQPGDRLWVREAWTFAGTLDPGVLVYRADYPACVPSHYKNVPPASALKWRPSIHMGRDQSRLELEITDVRVERLQKISEADARAEGIAYDPGEGGTFWMPGADCASDSAVDSYRKLWESINGPGSWSANPFVWVVKYCLAIA